MQFSQEGSKPICKRLRWSRGSVLAFGTQVHRFKPSRSRRIFKSEKILSPPSFRGEVKPSVPCRRFAACKRSLNGLEVVISAKLPDTILAHKFHLSPLGSLVSWGCGGTWWWKSECLNNSVCVLGLHNKPKGWGASGAYTAGPYRRRRNLNANAMFLQTIYRGSHFTNTTIHTHAVATQRVMVAKLTRFTQKIVMLWHLV
jgi:hypothetical protein